MSENYESSNKHVLICPRCKKTTVTGEFCKNCGYILGKKENVAQELRFGNKEATTAISFNEDTSAISYFQEATDAISSSKKVNFIASFIISLFAICFLFIPVFYKINIWNYYEKICSLYHSSYLTTETDLKFDTSTNLFMIIKSIFIFYKDNSIAINPSNMMALYLIIVSLATMTIVVSGCFLAYFSIRGILYKKMSKYNRILIGMIMGAGLLLIFALNCFAIPLISLVVLCASIYIYNYISGVISKERDFKLSYLINKTILCALFIFLLGTSTFGLEKLSIINGSNLFNFDSSGTFVDDGTIFSCRGFYLEFMQIIQSSSGDEGISNAGFILTAFGFILHAIYLIGLITSIVVVMQSTFNPSVSFPTKLIMHAFVSFILFAIVLAVYNELVNEASVQLFIDSATFDALNEEKQNELFSFYQVFKVNYGYFISLAASIICIIGSIIFSRRDINF